MIDETKYTPGPWEAHEQTKGLWVVCAEPSPLQRGLWAELDSGPSSEANARLIAAAPELAEALRRFVRAVSVSACPECDAEPGVNIDCELCMATSAAETALGKAGLR